MLYLENPNALYVRKRGFHEGISVRSVRHESGNVYGFLSSSVGTPTINLKFPGSKMSWSTYCSRFGNNQVALEQGSLNSSPNLVLAGVSGVSY